MTRKETILIHLRALKFSAWERLIDLINITFPIFVVSGIVVACFKFWLAVLS